MIAPGQLKLDRDAFLAQYWQRRPLLIRDAVDGFAPPIDADELAGLAMEDAVESRLVACRDGDWQVQHGPFTETAFRQEAPWTLLVQAVDHHVPGVAALRRLVDFIPPWRGDDIMVSYATDGGSVGPHYDNYDVFLLQGAGHKVWQLGEACDAASPLLPHEELRILKSFEAQHEYLLSPGDILYVPPGIAHCGTARGESVTFSIGFRSPRLRDMVARWADQLLETLDPELFYRDPGRDRAARPGEILAADLERARSQLLAALDSGEANGWFGELVTEPRGEACWADEDDLNGLRDSPGHIVLSPAAKLAWQEDADGTIQVFANGQRGGFDAVVIPCLASLCGNWRLGGTELDEALAEKQSRLLLQYLLESGVIHVQ